MRSRPEPAAAVPLGDAALRKRSVEIVGDIGGTRARFAIRGRVDGIGAIATPVILASADHSDLASAVRELCDAARIDPGALRRAAIAVAAPVTDDEVRLTNVGWRFSIAATAAELGLERLRILNDLEAVAWALPALAAGDVETIRSPAGRRSGTAPRVVVGVGTGLGTALFVPAAPGRRELAIAAEGGHRDLAAAGEREWRIVDRLARRHGHVSTERVLSGTGLVELHRTLAELDGVDAGALDAPAVAARARAGEARAREVFELFSAWLGAFCGDLVLSTGARGGVDLAGELLGALDGLFDRGRFLDRFLAKGRFRGWLEAVPVSRIVHPHAALLGCDRALRAPPTEE